MSFLLFLYIYLLGALTFIPLLVILFVAYTFYTSVPVTATHPSKHNSNQLESERIQQHDLITDSNDPTQLLETNDAPRTRKGWLTVRRTFEQPSGDTGYVTLMRSFLDSRSKDPRRSRPKDMWYVVLKGKVLYLYEDEQMTECEAAIELSSHDVVIFPENLTDGELFAKRNAICLRPIIPLPDKSMPSVTKEMKLEREDTASKIDSSGINRRKREKEKEKSAELEKKRDEAREEALDATTPWFIFVRSNVEMEDWYLALIHASEHPAQTPILEPLESVFNPVDMEYLVATLDEQPDVIPMRWLNALVGRIFFSYYQTHVLEAYIIGRLMKKLSKVKRPNFLSDIVVTEVSVGNRTPTFSKPMLKELTKEGDASMEVHMHYKGEIRITIEATATINISARLKTYTVKLVLAAILREIEGNLLVKVKRPPTNRIWYAFTQTPRMVLDVEPIVSERQITWGMILSTIESRLKEIIQESVVMPNMDDIAFFESGHYSRRGGIWPDASRKEKKLPIEITNIGQAAVMDSNLNGETQTVVPTIQQEHAIPPLQTQSTEVPSQANTFTHRNVEGIRSCSEEPSLDVRRRTWFPSVRNDGPQITNDQLSDTGEELIISDMRGRVLESGRSTSFSARSSRSRDEGASVLENEINKEDERGHSQTFLLPNGNRRSFSRHSTKSDSGDFGLTEDFATTGTPRKASDAASIISVPSSSPGSGSILSSLRSKDKQALKDSAKEAIRKLGVNWGLRKDSNPTPSNRDSLIEESQQPKDNSNSQVVKTRPRYADVRAAVEERREKEKATQPTTTTSEDTATQKDALPITPDGSSSDQGSDTVAPSSQSLNSSTSEDRARQPQQVQARLLADIDKNNESADAPKHTPIHVQPQAKMMTIPGIHASHRGEVMSMGYAPPSVLQENKVKNPTIQNVYRRLWKSPVLEGQESIQPQTDAASQVPERSGANDEDKDVTPLTLTPSVQSILPSRPVPPPLPPRSATAAFTLPSSGSPSMTLTLPSTTAFQALKTIATSDDSSRSRLADEVGFQEGDHLDKHNTLVPPEAKTPPVVGPSEPLPPAPPLPPRRVQTST
ncbi:hypothetical protein AMATHDRAFT_57386 [Amanita thiersii Skay4041]|uniref:SMP-LTD domain-containing protein n=1 Tax=Amanita thiersii Skay4041 TaxID=703135 RepID=A0A2A9NX54_9AGAR|nr:hypothetical protein AMATHDRAFT_57386 [Amanita thiersii Skay4041]